MLGLPPTAADTDCSDGVAGASGGAENARNGIGVGGWCAPTTHSLRIPLGVLPHVGAVSGPTQYPDRHGIPSGIGVADRPVGACMR